MPSGSERLNCRAVMEVPPVRLTTSAAFPPVSTSKGVTLSVCAVAESVSMVATRIANKCLLCLIIVIVLFVHFHKNSTSLDLP